MLEKLKPVLKWFGYTRRERRSSFILLLVLILIITVRYTVPDKPSYFEVISDSSLLNYLSVNSLASDTNTIALIRPGQKVKSYSRDINEQVQVKRSYVKLNINSCDSADLERLPFLGPVLSSRVVRYRKLLGGFVSVSQLCEVYGLSDSAVLILSERLSVDTGLIRKIDINNAQFGELLRHPYLERGDVQSIVKYRDLKGSIGSIEELVENLILSQPKAEKVKPYLSFKH